MGVTSSLVLAIATACAGLAWIPVASSHGTWLPVALALGNAGAFGIAAVVLKVRPDLPLGTRLAAVSQLWTLLGFILPLVIPAVRYWVPAIAAMPSVAVGVSLLAWPRIVRQRRWLGIYMFTSVLGASVAVAVIGLLSAMVSFGTAG
jgi:hypothetical protein